MINNISHNYTLCSQCFKCQEVTERSFRNVGNPILIKLQRLQGLKSPEHRLRNGRQVIVRQVPKTISNSNPITTNYDCFR